MIMKLKVSQSFTSRLRLSLALTGLSLSILTGLSFTVVALSSSTTTTINVNDAEDITIASSGTVNLSIIPSTTGTQTINNDIVTVATNDSAGYTLQLNETSSSATALASGGNTIPASSGTQSSPVAMAVNTWGYRVDGIGGFGAGPTSAVSSQPISATKFAKVPASTPDTLATTSSTSGGTGLSVWYGVAVDDITPFGTYTNNVTYTAVAN